MLPFLQAIEQRGIDTEEFLRKFDLNPHAIVNNKGMVSTRQIEHFIEGAALALKEPFFAWKSGWSLNHEAYALFSNILTPGIDLAQTFSQMVIYSAEQGTATRYDLHVEGAHTRFVSIRTYKGGPFTGIDAFICGALASLVKKFLGRTWKPSMVSLVLYTPNVIPSDIRCQRVASNSHCEIAIQFPTPWLLAQWGKPKRSQQTGRPLPRTKQKLAPFVRATLSLHIADQNLTTGRAAEYCGSSTHIVDKELKKEGATLSSIIAELRKQAACKLLKNSTDSIASIGAAVGYPDATSFSRVFHQWMGVSPRNYRKSFL
jgi:AraC-like DNA-binding protein